MHTGYITIVETSVAKIMAASKVTVDNIFLLAPWEYHLSLLFNSQQLRELPQLGNSLCTVSITCSFCNLIVTGISWAGCGGGVCDSVGRSAHRESPILHSPSLYGKRGWQAKEFRIWGRHDYAWAVNGFASQKAEPSPSNNCVCILRTEPLNMQSGSGAFGDVYFRLDQRIKPSPFCAGACRSSLYSTRIIQSLKEWKTEIFLCAATVFHSAVFPKLTIVSSRHFWPKLPDLEKLRFSQSSPGC